jgi:mannose-1-phosphate guanylyltransferase
VLAAGDGRRLEGYVKQIRGDELPKQYCSLMGRRSMLEHTYHRIKRLISPERILTVVARHHLKYPEVRQQLAQQPEANIIIQPQNKETGPGILLPLMHVYKRCPDAIAVLFPSDHFVLEENRFMAYVDRAARAVVQNPLRILLLATEARSAETELGYVVPAQDAHACGEIRRVAGFVEKPDLQSARRLIDSGALWNTMITVFKVTSLLKMLGLFHPFTQRRFFSLLASLGTGGEALAVDKVYRTLAPMNFSRDFLEKVTATYPEMVGVLPVRRVFWSDWGSPKRLWETRQELAKSAAVNQKWLDRSQRLVASLESLYDSGPQRSAGLAKQ